MQLKDLKLEDWFGYDFDESDEEEYSEEDARIYALMFKNAEDTVQRILEKPTGSETPSLCLLQFYNAWKKMDPNDDADLRSVVFDFIKEVIKLADSSLDPSEVLSDIQYGHIGISFRNSSELFPFMTKDELETSVEMLVRNLKEQLTARIPGLMNIRIRKNPTPPYSVTYSLITKDVTEDIELINIQGEGDAPELIKFSYALMKVVKQKNGPLQVENLGIFQIEDVPPYNGKNLQTGEAILIPGRKAMVFRIDKAILQSLE